MSQYLLNDDQSEDELKRRGIQDFAAFWELMVFARPYAKDFIWGALLITFCAICAVGSGRIIGILVDEGLVKKDFNVSMGLAAAVVLLEAILILALWAGRRLLTRASSFAILDIREKLFIHLENLPIQYYDRQPQGRIIVRLTHDVEDLESFLTSSLGRLFNALTMALVAMFAMLTTDFYLGGILVCSIFPALVFIYLTRNKVRSVNRDMSRFSSVVNSKLAEYINGIDVIRAFGLEGWASKKYSEHVDEHVQSQLRANLLFGWTRPFMSFLCASPLILLVWVGGHSVLAGTMEVGLFVAFIKYCDRFYNPILTLSREIHVVQQAFTSAERIVSFLRERPESQTFINYDEADTNFVFAGKIEFKELWMAYREDDFVLKNINFVINKGDKVGLVGETGSGKTSTISLIARLYEFQQGSIFLDDHDIRGIDRTRIRSQIGLVSQDVVLFKGTLKENLVTHLGITGEEVLEACCETGLIDVMTQKGIDLNANIYEAGSNFSSGERQLISLTRILLRNPSVLIMDEATANIDPHYEKVIHTAVDKIMQGRTCIIIAHRLKTLEHCDRIMVFKNGELVDEGSRERLLERSDYFKKLYSTGINTFV